MNVSGAAGINPYFNSISSPTGECKGTEPPLKENENKATSQLPANPEADSTGGGGGREPDD